MRKLIFNSLCNLLTKACAKTIVISLTSLIIGTIASVLVTPLIFCLATGVIISGVREAGS